jgi:hypothetical protein
MSYVPKAFYGFLIFVMLASFIGTWDMLGRSENHQNTFWPRHIEHNDEQDYYDAHRPWFGSLTGNTIWFFDSIIGKIVCLALIAAITFGCGKLAFKYEYLYTGLFTLMAFAAYCAWIAIFLKFFDPFIPVIRM